MNIVTSFIEYMNILNEWCITGLLGEYNVEPFRRKVNCYLSFLENIANTEEGRRSKTEKSATNTGRQVFT
ncbi:unnamed protein product [Rhizophagus irregularis]|nr:unnamed protein product [Rhizophagus irregularis]CAB5394139.1 unnamed protein product [Rhizophagus irregularis]